MIEKNLTLLIFIFAGIGNRKLIAEKTEEIGKANIEIYVFENGNEHRAGKLIKINGWFWRLCLCYTTKFR